MERTAFEQQISLCAFGAAMSRKNVLFICMMLMLFLPRWCPYYGFLDVFLTSLGAMLFKEKYYVSIAV